MANNFLKNQDVYASSNEVKMHENGKRLFSNSSPDFDNICVNYYRQYTGEMHNIKDFARLTFYPYSPTEITERIWLPESFIGTFTGKEYGVGRNAYIQVEYSANKITYKNPNNKGTMQAYEDIKRLAWIKKSEASDTGY